MERTIAEKDAMAKMVVFRALWREVAPLVPAPKPSPKGGRPPVADRAWLGGIVLVLKTEIPWQMLTARLGYERLYLLAPFPRLNATRSLARTPPPVVTCARLSRSN
jgi:hypothetical protein